VSTIGLLDALWTDYVGSTPQAERVHHLLAARGELIHHDHVVVRTFSGPAIGITALAAAFEELGWQPRGRPRVEGPHVRARSWVPPQPDLPMLLISEVEVTELSPGAQAIIGDLVAQLPPGFARHDLAKLGRPWKLASADYLALRAESEHAAWVAAFGPRAHHFSVDVSALATFPDLVALDAYLIEHGFPLDVADPFEKSSTRADSVEVAFTDTSMRIPSGTYELVLRARRARERREVVVELEQHVDVDADELNAHPVHRGPPHHRG
jgi:hypothetical protein